MRRRLAREIAVQALYQMEMNNVTAADAVAMIAEEASQEDSELGAERSALRQAVPRALELVEGATGARSAIDGLLQQ
jgi:N utilization substance protein B